MFNDKTFINDCYACLVDLAGDFNSVKRSIDNAIEQMGPPYLFVNCAGMALCGTLEDNSPDDIRVFLQSNIQQKYVIHLYNN